MPQEQPSQKEAKSEVPEELLFEPPKEKDPLFSPEELADVQQVLAEAQKKYKEEEAKRTQRGAELKQEIDDLFQTEGIEKAQKEVAQETLASPPKRELKWPR